MNSLFRFIAVALPTNLLLHQYMESPDPPINRATRVLLVPESHHMFKLRDVLGFTQIFHHEFSVAPRPEATEEVLDSLHLTSRILLRTA